MATVATVSHTPLARLTTPHPLEPAHMPAPIAFGSIPADTWDMKQTTPVVRLATRDDIPALIAINNASTIDMVNGLFKRFGLTESPFATAVLSAFQSNDPKDNGVYLKRLNKLLKNNQLHLLTLPSTEIIGLAELKPYQRPEIQPLIRRYGQKETACIENVFVIPEYRGQGNGKLLLTHIDEAAKALGFQRIILHAEDKALGFYKAIGYEPVKPLAALWYKAPLTNLLLSSLQKITVVQKALH
jgi:GNAT superfamily N-acetyltransferase